MQLLQRNVTLQNGRYRIEKVLGQGGFGITYEGETTTDLGGNLGSMQTTVRVAIKEFFMQDFCQRQEDGRTVKIIANERKVLKYKDKFVKEANKLADISHPNIVKAIHVFEENNTVYYVMLFLKGGSLSSQVKHHPLGRLDPAVAIDYIKQVGNALTYLHNEKKMCHFDVKPANILINSKGQAVLIDFGISKTFSDSTEDSATSSISYSASYSPLELYQPMTKFSPQTDIYSLGATLYYLVTGKTPPEATEINDTGMPEKFPYVTEALWQAICKAMQPRRTDRPATVADWLEMLDNEYIDDAGDDTATVVGGGHTVVDDVDDDDDNDVDIDDPEATSQKTAATTTTKKAKSKGMMFTIAVVFVAIVAAVGGVIAVNVLMPSGPVNKPTASVVEVKPMSTYEAMRELDKTDLTLKQIRDIKKACKNDGTDDEQQKFKKRVNALTLLYQEVLTNPKHEMRVLNNVYRSYQESFSQQQVHAILTIFNKPTALQKKWEGTEMTVNSLAEFEQKINELK